MPCISRDGSTIVFRHLFDFYRLSAGLGQATPAARHLLRQRRGAGAGGATHVGVGHRGQLLLRRPGVGHDRRRQRLGHGHRALRAASDHFQRGGGEFPRVCSRRQVDPVCQRHGRRDRHLAGHAGRFPQVLVAKRPLRASAADARFGEQVGRAMEPYRRQGGLRRKDGATCGSWIPTAKMPTACWRTGTIPPTSGRPTASGSPMRSYDDDFNRDVWVLPVDGSRPPVNLSCHPNIDDNPAWSPDGRIIAFTGRRQGVEAGHLFRLPPEGGRRGRRPRSGRATGVEKLRKARSQPESGDAAREGNQAAPPGEASAAAKPSSKVPRPLKPPPKVRIDFDHIADRIHHVSIPDMTEGRLWWSPDSTKLAFTAAPEGKPGVYTIAPPDDLVPELLSTRAGQVGPLAVAGQPHRVALLRHTGLADPRQGRGALPFFGAAGSRRRPQVRRGLRPLLADDARPLLRSAFE